MKILKTCSLVALLFLAGFAVSCGGSSDSCDLETVVAEVFTKSFDMASAQSDFEDDPQANCASYKAALEDYISFLEANQSCLESAGLTDQNGNPASISGEISTAKSNLANVDC